MKPIDRKLFRDVAHLRGQVIAVALVVACGIAAFVSMRSVYFSLKATLAAYYVEYRFAHVFAHLTRAPDSLAARIAAIPGVGEVQTRIVANVTLDVPGVAEPARGRIISIPDQRTPMPNDLRIVSGRYIDAGKTDEIIISEAFSAANALHPGDGLAAIVNGHWRKLRIVGVALSPEYVYEIGGGEMFPDSRRFGVLWMARSALGPAFDMKDAFNDVAIVLGPGGTEAQVIDRLDAVLDRSGGLGAYGRDDQVSHHFIANEIDELQVTSTFIPGIFLGVTAFLLHLVLSRLVATQRDQIAVLKAFGYGNVAIGWHYLKLAYVAIAGGVLVGIGVGWWFGYSLTAIYAHYFRFPVLRYSPGAGMVLAAVGISLAAATVGALAAVRRAVSLPPAEAMRPEPPARFQAGFLETIGVAAVLSPSVRIIARNLARRPMKALLTTFGIALSTSLLVTGFYLLNDATERLTDVVFRQTYREDVSVTFNEPRPASVRHDIARLPGVQRVEAQRTLPVRLRFGHRSRRVALTGLDAAAELRRIVDMDYRVTPIPPEGVLLTAKLAKILGVAPGDTLTVDVLEGERPTRPLVVAGTVNDLIGLSAYIDITALNRLMREGGTIDGLHLSVDAKHLPDLYATLKVTPAVRGVLVPGALLDNFNKTINRTMGTSTAFIVFFACIIAFGMVYNGARITLSERGRELASLRVLGFTRREIGVMLLGEQALLTLAAIPLGSAMGFGLVALITWAIDTDLMRLPLVVSGRTFARSAGIIVLAACLSGVLVALRLRKLDLVEALKTRE